MQTSFQNKTPEQGKGDLIAPVGERSCFWPPPTLISQSVGGRLGCVERQCEEEGGWGEHRLGEIIDFRKGMSEM